jgi:DNA-binding response OmpR family regulator
LEAGPAGGEGDEAVRRVRSATDVPLILVTRGSGQADRARGLEQGADDCLSAPVNPRELAARAKAILRRAPAANPTARLLVVGDLTLDLAGRTATVAGRELALRAREFDLLAALAREPGVVLSRGRLLEEVWELAGDIKTRTLDVHAQRLREQLAGSGLAIETVRGIGLKLVAADR